MKTGIKSMVVCFASVNLGCIQCACANYDCGKLLSTGTFGNNVFFWGLIGSVVLRSERFHAALGRQFYSLP